MTPSSRQDPQASGTGTDFPPSQARVLVSPSLRWAYYEQVTPSIFFHDSLNARSKKNNTDKLRTRTSFQWFLNKTPSSPFKKLIVSMPNLLPGLHMMSLAKSVPKGLNPQECERTKLCKPPPVPYIPELDKVQEEVMKL